MRSVVSVKSWFITYFKVGHHCFRSQIRHELQAFEQMKRKGYGQVIVQFSSGLDFKVRINVEGLDFGQGSYLEFLEFYEEWTTLFSG